MLLGGGSQSGSGKGNARMKNFGEVLGGGVVALVVVSEIIHRHPQWEFWAFFIGVNSVLALLVWLWEKLR